MSEFELAKGVKDWYGESAILRNKIRDTLRNIFERYGYNPLETPIIEMQKTLGYKGGGEIQKEVFKLSDQGKRELALRFDQTVPLARFVATSGDVKLPFKRYAIGNVFRDGPTQPDQGRYRIFTQCDVDVLGVKDMSAEVELFSLARDAFKELGLGDVEVKINNRKLLEGVLDYANIPQEYRIKTIATLDKMDKIGLEGVREELNNLKYKNNIKISNTTFDYLKNGYLEEELNILNKKFVENLLIEDLGKEGFEDFKDKALKVETTGEFITLIDSYEFEGNNILNSDSVKKLLNVTQRQSNNEETYKGLCEIINSDIGKEGLNEVGTILNYSNKMNYDFIQFDPTLARGLDYYTGTTIEVYLKDKSLVKSAILAGGRYDNMVGDFKGNEEIPAVGFSFGLERLVMVLKNSENVNKNTSQIYLIPMGDTKEECLKIANDLRSQGLNVDLELRTNCKPKKSIKYASSVGISNVAFVGENEIKENYLSIKNLKTGQQNKINLNEVKKYLN